MVAPATRKSARLASVTASAAVSANEVASKVGLVPVSTNTHEDKFANRDRDGDVHAHVSVSVPSEEVQTTHVQSIQQQSQKERNVELDVESQLELPESMWVYWPSSGWWQARVEKDKNDWKHEQGKEEEQRQDTNMVVQGANANDMSSCIDVKGTNQAGTKYTLTYEDTKHSYKESVFVRGKGVYTIEGEEIVVSLGKDKPEGGVEKEKEGTGKNTKTGTGTRRSKRMQANTSVAAAADINMNVDPNTMIKQKSLTGSVGSPSLSPESKKRKMEEVPCSPQSPAKSPLKSPAKSPLKSPLKSPDKGDKIEGASPPSVTKKQSSTKAKLPVLSKSISISNTTNTTNSNNAAPAVSKTAITQALRDKVIQVLAEALESPPSETAKNLAAEIEFECDGMHNGDLKKYKDHMRSLSFNIKVDRNPELNSALMDGAVTPQQLVQMSSDELASRKIREEREKQQKEMMSRIIIADPTAVGLIKAPTMTEQTEARPKSVMESKLLAASEPVVQKPDAYDEGMGLDDDTASQGVDDDHSGNHDDTAKATPAESEEAAPKTQTFKESSAPHMQSAAVVNDMSVEFENFAATFEVAPDLSNGSKQASLKNVHFESETGNEPEAEAEAKAEANGQPKVEKDQEYEPEDVAITAVAEDKEGNDLADKQSSIKHIDSLANRSAKNIWFGSVENPESPHFEAVGNYLLGPKSASFVIPSKAEIRGRVDLTQILEFFQQLQSSSSRVVLVFYINPISQDHEPAYWQFCEFLNQRSRAAVVVKENDMEVYLVPPGRPAQTLHEKGRERLLGVVVVKKHLVRADDVQPVGVVPADPYEVEYDPTAMMDNSGLVDVQESADWQGVTSVAPPSVPPPIVSYSGYTAPSPQPVETVPVFDPAVYAAFLNQHMSVQNQSSLAGSNLPNPAMSSYNPYYNMQLNYSTGVQSSAPAPLSNFPLQYGNNLAQNMYPNGTNNRNFYGGGNNSGGYRRGGPSNRY